MFTKMPLIRRSLIAILSISAITIPLFIIIIWAITKGYINNIYKNQMMNSAELLLAIYEHEIYEEKDEDELDKTSLEDEFTIVAENAARDYQLNLYFKIHTASGQNIYYGDVSYLNCPVNTTKSLSKIKNNGIGWYCYHLKSNVTNTSASVFKESKKVDTITANIIWHNITPLLILLPLFSMIIFLIIRTFLKPLKQIEAEVSKRSFDDLSPLEFSNAPIEIQPILNAANHLMEKLKEGYIREKRFTNDAAHELKTPLASIKMITENIKDLNEDKELIPSLNMLDQSVNISNQLIEQLLSFARMQNIQNATTQQINLGQLLEETLSIFATQISEKNIIIEFDREKPKSIINANLPMMQILFNNLISNAVKFSRPNGMISIHILKDKIQISDQGIGLDNNDLDSIFKRFYRSNRSQNISGSGLGLSICQWIANHHGYKIYAGSNHPQGAIFTLEWGALSDEI